MPTIAPIVITLVFGIVSIPYVGEWLAAFAMLHDAGAATNATQGPSR